MLVGYEMIIAIYHLIYNARSWNNCQSREQRGQSDCSICDKTLVDLLLDKIVS